jgi:hypothetical protein
MKWLMTHFLTLHRHRRHHHRRRRRRQQASLKPFSIQGRQFNKSAIVDWADNLQRLF